MLVVVTTRSVAVVTVRVTWSLTASVVGPVTLAEMTIGNSKREVTISMFGSLLQGIAEETTVLTTAAVSMRNDSIVRSINGYPLAESDAFVLIESLKEDEVDEPLLILSLNGCQRRSSRALLFTSTLLVATVGGPTPSVAGQAHLGQAHLVAPLGRHAGGISIDSLTHSVARHPVSSKFHILKGEMIDPPLRAWQDKLVPLQTRQETAAEDRESC